MKLGTGLRYVVMNYVTGAYTHFQAHDVALYRQQYLVFGTASKHAVHVVRGVMPVGERASSFVVMQDATDAEVVAFCEHMKGLPLALRPAEDTSTAAFIVNRGTCRDPGCDRQAGTCTLFHGPLESQDDHQKKNVQTVNEFFNLKGSGRLKALVADARVAARLAMAAKRAPRQAAPLRPLWTPNGRH